MSELRPDAGGKAQARKRVVRLPYVPHAETYVQEINVLHLEGLLFDFSRKHGDKSVETIETTDASGQLVRLRFDPRYQRPSILAFRLLQAIFRKLTSEGHPFNASVSFARHELMELAGRGNKVGGAQGEELYRAIQQLRRTDIECSIFTKATGTRETLVFSLINSALFSEHRGRVQACSLVPDPMIIQNLNDRHWAAFNWERMKHLDPVAMVLYKQLFWQLCRLAGRTVKELEAAHAEHPIVMRSAISELRYNKDLGDVFASWLGGLKMPPRKAKILEKYRDRFEALKNSGLIRSYEIQPAATEGRFTLIVRPGRQFVADYLDLYLSRYQPQLKIQTAHEKATIEEPLKLVSDFFKALNGSERVDSDVFSEKDRKFAATLIAKYGAEHAQDFVRYAAKAAQCDKFPIRHFSGAKQYVNPWLAGRDPERRKRPASSTDDVRYDRDPRPISQLLDRYRPSAK